MVKDFKQTKINRNTFNRLKIKGHDYSIENII